MNGDAEAEESCLLGYHVHIGTVENTSWDQPICTLFLHLDNNLLNWIKEQKKESLIYTNAEYHYYFYKPNWSGLSTQLGGFRVNLHDYVLMLHDHKNLLQMQGGTFCDKLAEEILLWLKKLKKKSEKSSLPTVQ